MFRESITSFEEMAAVPVSSNRYVRTGLAESYSGLGDLYTSLANAQNLSSSLRIEDWKEARTLCQKSLAVWIDKQKREELESDERNETAKVVQCIATAESDLNGSSRKR